MSSDKNNSIDQPDDREVTADEQLGETHSLAAASGDTAPIAPGNRPAQDWVGKTLVKNFLTTTLLSLGVPMILMGDEVRHTQRGNNNAYCQDNELSWFDWTNLDRHADLRRFVSLLCARRMLRNVDPDRQRISVIRMLREANKAWHGVRLHQPDWGDASHCIAFGGELRRAGLRFHLILNAYWEPLEFDLPELDHGRWRRWIDTGCESPDDIVPWEQAPEIRGNSYRAIDRSVVMLYANTNQPEGVGEK